MLRISQFGFDFSFRTGFFVISTTFVISAFDSVWLKNNLCSLVHKDWLSLFINYHVVFDITWHFYWNRKDCFQAHSQVIDSFPVWYTLSIANVSKALLWKTFAFPQKVFFFIKNTEIWNIFEICTST